MVCFNMPPPSEERRGLGVRRPADRRSCELSLEEHTLNRLPWSLKLVRGDLILIILTGELPWDLHRSGDIYICLLPPLTLVEAGRSGDLALNILSTFLSITTICEANELVVASSSVSSPDLSEGPVVLPVLSDSVAGREGDSISTTTVCCVFSTMVCGSGERLESFCW